MCTYDVTQIDKGLRGVTTYLRFLPTGVLLNINRNDIQSVNYVSPYWEGKPETTTVYSNVKNL